MESVVASHSVLVLDALASSSECASLAEEASALARVELHERAMLEECGLLDDTMDHDAGRVRMHIRDYLADDSQQICERLLLRALQMVSTRLFPGDEHAAFGDCVATSSFSVGFEHPLFDMRV